MTRTLAILFVLLGTQAEAGCKPHHREFVMRDGSCYHRCGWSLQAAERQRYYGWSWLR